MSSVEALLLEPTQLYMTAPSLYGVSFRAAPCVFFPEIFVSYELSYNGFLSIELLSSSDIDSLVEFPFRWIDLDHKFRSVWGPEAPLLSCFGTLGERL